MALFAASLLVLQAVAAPALPATVPCSGENHGALDFWVGEWDVYRNGSDALVAHSTIEKLYEGCAIRETWMPLGGKPGGSLSGYDPATGRWHQTWIGSTAGVVLFEGGPAEGVAEASERVHVVGGLGHLELKAGE